MLLMLLFLVNAGDMDFLLIIIRGVSNIGWSCYQCQIVDILKHCYLLLKSLDDVQRISWATHVKNLLFRYGFGYVWIAQEVGNDSLFLYNFAKRLKDCNQQDWRGTVGESSKLLVFKEYKSRLSVELYLSASISHHFRRILCLLRVGELPLMVNVGRRIGLPRSERLCQYCNLSLRMNYTFC